MHYLPRAGALGFIPSLPSEAIDRTRERLQFLMELPHQRTRVYAERLLHTLRWLLRVVHRRETMTLRGFAMALEKAHGQVMNAATWAPPRREAQNLARRFRLHGDAYFRFITTPGVEPTNNLAEQAIRFVVIDRRITQDTRSECGQRWCERIWTAIATCTQQDRSVFDYLFAKPSTLTSTVNNPLRQ